MMDVEAVIWRPMPVEEVRIGSLAVPVEFHFAPEPGHGVANLALGSVVSVEVLPCNQQSLHEERRLDEVSAVVVLSEVGVHLAGVTVEEVRPHAVEAVSFRRKRTI